MGPTTDQPTAEESALGQASISLDDGHSDPVNPVDARTELNRQLNIRELETTQRPAIIEPKAVEDHLNQVALHFSKLANIGTECIEAKPMRRILVLQAHISTDRNE